MITAGSAFEKTQMVPPVLVYPKRGGYTVKFTTTCLWLVPANNPALPTQLTHSQGDLNRLSPVELGYAAAYQAYVKVMDDPSVSRNIEYERETLIGLAVSEGMFFESFSPRNRADSTHQLHA